MMARLSMKAFLKYPLLRSAIYLIGLVGILWAFSGCKDTEATHVAGGLETCKVLLDERQWADAIDACNDLESDEGKHLTAIAYMGRSGLTMATILTELSDSSITPTSLLYDYIPDTAVKVSDFKSALNILMAEIGVKDQTIYMEGILISSLLIFRELKTLLSLTMVSGQIETCAGDPADLNNCSFKPSIGVVPVDIPDSLIFGGLGSAFYRGICADISTDVFLGQSNYDGTSSLPFNLTLDPTYGTVSGNLNYDVTVDSAIIQAGSPLYYNKVASEAYALVGTEDLSSLNFYTKMDTGNNFAITVSPFNPVTFCTGVISLPAASDAAVSDCEILSFLENPGF